MMKTLDISLWPPRAHIFMNTHAHISVMPIHTDRMSKDENIGAQTPVGSALNGSKETQELPFWRL